MNPLTTAIRIAAEAHGDTLDKTGREPYILHPLRVMMVQQSEMARIVGVLHDVVEDTDVSFEDLERAGIPGDAVAALRLLTKPRGADYQAYVDKIKPNPIARAVKLADLEDNMNIRRLETIGDAERTRLAKYLRAWRTLQES
jgi:hypothetical protein